MKQMLPNSIEAEQAVLGAILKFGDGMQVAHDEGLHQDDFFEDRHSKIFEVMLELNDSRQKTDFTSVAQKLSDKRWLDIIGGNEYLFTLSEKAISSKNIKYHIDIIQEKSQKRKLHEAASLIESYALDGEKELGDLFSESEKLITDVTRNRKTTDFRTSAEVADAVYEDVQIKSNSGTSIDGLATGFIEFDRITNGLHKGDLIILAARPSVGKTAFALNLGLRCAMNAACTVALFSLEMPAEQLMGRMLSSDSRVNNNKFKTGKLTDDEWAALTNSVGVLHKQKIYIDDSSTIKVNEIFAKCRKLKNDTNQLDLIIIDYLQLISGSGKSRDNRQQEVSEISRSLKQLAREMECPVIALSQLSRSVEQRGDHTPLLSDLRESGSIEQDADIVIFLDRADYQKTKKDSDEKETDEVKNEDFIACRVIFAKHRNGAIGEIELGFTKSISRFDNLERRQSV